ncbi:MAG TPA: acyl carrier protein [Casimicrobiaceae bacterium]|nr:acyl carrier protein [Casimicrobiaceae bacterium]
MSGDPYDRATLQQSLLTVLRRTAPEVSTLEIDATRPLRDQVDLDSIDWLNFLVGLHQRLGVDIPESDYAKLRTLNDLVDYLDAKLAAGAA